MNSIVIIGGGPAGLRAGEAARALGASVAVYDHKASVGRKFLVAGRGGLNLTHADPFEAFVERYGEPCGRWRDLVRDFDNAALRAWAKELGIETYVGTSRRVFPMEQKAAPLLRRWVQRLKAQGVKFHLHHRWTGLTAGNPLSLTFRSHDQTIHVQTNAVVLACGGASWPETGSDGAWTAMLEKQGVRIAPWQPANCGWETDWPAELRGKIEGLPLKNIAVEAGGVRVEGELLLTKYGMEGGALYQLGRVLRALPQPAVAIDFKPSFSAEDLLRKLGGAKGDGVMETAARNWRLSEAAAALVASRGPFADPETLAWTVKRFEVVLRGPRPMEEAISSAGGVEWGELDENLMFKKLPGVFAAGEMIDWEAPTGGFLLQGCFATGTRAGRAAARLSKN
jgi:uncharacterized flavoprotein (TIGR03862 family)